VERMEFVCSKSLGNGDALRCLFRVSLIFLLASMEGAVAGGEGVLVRVDHGTGQHRDVAVRADPVVWPEIRGECVGALPAKDSMTEGFFKRKLIRPIIDLLKQGVTPEKIALSIALGAVLGVFPALGSTTALCAIAALVLKLNLPAIQIVNYFMYPAQIALIIPFFRLGEYLFGAQKLSISVQQIYAMIQASMWGAIKTLWTTTWHAIVAWGLLAPIFVGLIYVILTPLFRRAIRLQKTQTTEEG